MLTRRSVLTLLAAGLPALAGACTYGPPYGPPPHAPAYGLRRKLVWDPDLSIYTVVGQPGIYYLEPYYYRWGGDYWLYSRSLRDWRRTPERGLPPGLARKHGRGGHDFKDHGRGGNYFGHHRD